ncbi:MAG: tetratricopeptide repeat protein [Xanthomonadales bacterium]|nr:tetratricopeptide repeat protein [Xanthomonadales bacterium]
MRRVSAAALMAGVFAAAGAASLSEVPEQWADRVAPIPQQRLGELEAATAGRIRETRSRLAGMLDEPDASAAELAAVYGRLGALYGAHRMYAGAELAFANARALDPRGFQWAYYAAHLALEQGEPGQALRFLAEAAQIDPDYPTLPLRRGEALLGLSRLREARAAYEQVVEAPELRAAGLYGLAQIDLLERDWVGAAARYGEVLSLQPGADAAQYPLGQALVRLGRREKARSHLERRGVVKPVYADPLVDELRSLQTGASFHFEEALVAVKRLDYAAAATGFAAGLAEDPANARARVSYARALWLSGRPDEAEAALRRAIADAPEEALPRFLLAVVEDAADDPVSAIGGYRRVLAIDPEHEGALSYLANLALRRGDYADAVAHFERAIASGVTQMPVFLHYWGALLRAGTHDALLRDKLVAFDKRFPEPPLFRYLLAKLLATSKETGVVDTDRALGIARQLFDAQPIPPHTELLALTLAATGDFTQALELQEFLVEMARLSGAFTHAVVLDQVTVSYRSRRLPEPIWPLQDLMLMPPPADPDSSMRNYPAGQPY